MSSNRKIGLMALGGAAAMLGLGFASAPLYRIFCEVTGFGGTPGRVSEAQAAEVKRTGKTVTVRFDANVERGMPWQFRPEVGKLETVIGQRKLATFEARNTSDHAITGQAVFNVSPERAGQYFKKIQCFCFNEQKLEAGQDVRMPVIYYVDPAILDDPDAKDIAEITLSYTFLPMKNQPAQPVNAAGAVSVGAAGKTAAK